MMTKVLRESWFRRVTQALGPGVTTGAADDDPSGVATYSIVGAQYGTSFLWSALITWPLMGCVQMMCARVGMVTGMGLAGALRQKFPRWVVAVISLALLIANTINIASDLAGMADAAQMLRCRPLIDLRLGIWSWHLRSDGTASLSPDCECAEVARARFVRLRHHRFPGASALVRCIARHGVAFAAAGAGRLGRACGDPRHDHQPVSLLLAGRPGGGRRESQGSAAWSSIARARRGVK